MVCIWRGLGPTDGWLAHHWLGAAGIRSELRGAQLVSVIGEIPAMDSWPSVWVDSADEAKGRAALAERDGPRLVSPPWACVCGETNEPPFDLCWSCGREH